MLSERFRFHLWLGAPSIGGARLGPIRGVLVVAGVESAC